MTDLVARLWVGSVSSVTAAEAIAEIERLQTENGRLKAALAEIASTNHYQMQEQIKRLRAALEPFRDAAKMVSKIGLAHACAAYIKASHLDEARRIYDQSR